MVLENINPDDNIDIDDLDLADVADFDSSSKQESLPKVTPETNGASLKTKERVTSDTQTQLQNEAQDNKINPGLSPAKINNPRRVGSKSWKPASLLHVTNKDPKFTYHFFDTTSPGRVNKALAEGWEFDKENNSSQLNIRDIKDGSPQDGVKRVRELVLMRIPKEMAESRNKYYQNMEYTPRKLKEQFQAGAKGEIYGDIVET